VWCTVSSIDSLVYVHRRNFVCDGGDCHHHFIKVEFAIFQAILSLTILQDTYFPHTLEFGQENRIFLATRSVLWLKHAENAISAGAPTLGPAGGAHDAPRPDPLVGWEGDIPPLCSLPIPDPTRRFWRVDARAFGASIVVPP